MGCFWGAEKKFWSMPGVWVTAVGYQGGQTANPTYRETCTGHTGHAEVVRIVFDPAVVSYEQLLQDVLGVPRPDAGVPPGKRYRDAVPLRDLHPRRRPAAQRRSRRATCTRASWRRQATARSRRRSREAGPFYFAEDYHQQYLAKNPRGYCPNHATGVKLPDGFVVTPLQYVD